MRYVPTFHRQSPLFWPIAAHAEKLAKDNAWPTVTRLTQVFGDEAPVRFELAPPKPRQKRLSANERYDAKIALEHVVPTREGSWHDLFNALVWISFPKAKAALHARQHRIIASRIGEDLRLPGARTREQDAIAMFDEGGVVLLRGPSPEASDKVAIFGHAIYESLVAATPLAIRAAAIVVPVGAKDPQTAGSLARVDEALGALFARAEPIAREDFTSFVIETL